jgi:DNA-binding NtrC family response regulator
MDLPILFGAPSGRAGAVANLLARDYPVLHAADLTVALAECRRHVPPAAVLPMPHGAAAEDVLRFLREQGRRTTVFLYTEGAIDAEESHRYLAAGARAMLDASAPDFAVDLARRLMWVLREKELRHAEDESLARLFARHDVVGASPAMRDAFRRALKANRFADLPVVIEGAKGTPKRRLAAAILYLDPDRIRMPFFALNCSGLGSVLGNVPGLAGGKAQADAEQWQQLLKGARGGTLFLDDIGTLDRELQPFLLNVVRRPAEMRIIVATEQPMEELVRQGALDAQLADWLGLFRIPLPSLRGRPEDITAQARHALFTLRPDAEFGPGVLEVLQRLPWEGNTMQLEAVVRQAAEARKEDTTLRLEDFPPWVGAVRADAPLPSPVPHPGDWTDGTDLMDVAAEEYERRLLRDLLQRHEPAEVHPHHSLPAGTGSE